MAKHHFVQRKRTEEELGLYTNIRLGLHRPTRARATLAGDHQATGVFASGQACAGPHALHIAEAPMKSVGRADVFVRQVSASRTLTFTAIRPCLKASTGWTFNTTRRQSLR